MISQLLAVIMMACGVASGTKASSNTFYDENNKPQIKKTVESINANYESGPVKSGYYEYIQNQNSYYKGYEKRYLVAQNETDTANQPYFQMTDIGIMYNSIYTTNEKLNNGYYASRTYILLKMVNYTRSVAKYTMNTETTLNMNNPHGYLFRWVYTSNNTDIDQYLDLTMTVNTSQILYDNLKSNNSYWTVINSTTVEPSYNSPTVHIENQSNYIEMQPEETKYILIITDFRVPDSCNSADTSSIELNINGNFIGQEITQEIIDVPGLMFTVLTMPFSFISTAFNLTIFPNTPYQINFSNLFMVILATFILMWIIKKVLHG